LQSVIGKLNWCARVVRGGRTFLRNLINLLVKVTESYHFIRITTAAKQDLLWWIVALDKFHGHAPFSCDIPTVSSEFSTDACMNGGGGHFDSDWFFVSWKEDFPTFCSSHINVLELKSVLIAAERWGHLWYGRHIIVKSDNMSAVAAVNKSTSRSPELLYLIKQLFWLSVEHNFKLSAEYLPGKLNFLADGLSRMHEKFHANYAMYLLTGSSFNCLSCMSHMSYSAHLSLQLAWSAR
jgi:hypothetical protein